MNQHKNTTRIGRRLTASQVVTFHRPAGAGFFAEGEMNIYIVKRDGAIVMRTLLEVHSDGTLWSGKTPLVNSTATGGCDMKTAKKLCKAGRGDEIPACMLCRVGENEGGLMVISDKDDRAEQQAAARKYRAEHPEIAEREAISILRDEADRLENSGSEDNVSGPLEMRARARKMMQAWREKYPQAAREEDARNLRDRASRKRELAVGALVYDADGWLNRDEQQSRHDEIMSEAVALEEEAAKLEG